MKIGMSSSSMMDESSSSMMDEWNYLRACYLWPRVVRDMLSHAEKGMINQRGDRNENNKQTLLALRDFVESRVSMEEVINDINAGMVYESLMDVLPLLKDSVRYLTEGDNSYERYMSSSDIQKAESYATKVVKELMDSSYP